MAKSSTDIQIHKKESSLYRHFRKPIREWILMWMESVVLNILCTVLNVCFPRLGDKVRRTYLSDLILDVLFLAFLAVDLVNPIVSFAK